MYKILFFVLICTGAWACKPVDPALVFMKFNNAIDGELNLSQWQKVQIPPILRLNSTSKESSSQSNLDLFRSEAKFRQIDADGDGKISLKELHEVSYKELSFIQDPCEGFERGIKENGKK